MKTFLIVDTSSYMHKAYHGYGMRCKQNWVAIGLASYLKKLIDAYKPTYLLSAEDTKSNAFLRRQLYPKYKSSRIGKSGSDERNEQFEIARDFLASTKIKRISKEGYEADDVIAAVVKKLKGAEDVRIVIVTGDKDMAQLVDSENDVEVHLNNAKGNGPLNNEELIVEDDVLDKYGVSPKLIPALFGMIGDKNDDIPGCPGMHENVAIDMINIYETLDEIYDNNIHDGEIPDNFRALLKAHRDIIYKSEMLASPLPIEIHETLGAFIYRDVSPELVSFGLNVEPQILKIFGLDHIKSVKKFSEYIVLVGYLNTVSKAYYKTGYSNISDQDFDRLLEQLRGMEKEMDYVHPNSPTHKVGSDKTEFGKPVKHAVPMLSLDNSYDPEELLKFMQSIQKQYDKLTIPFEVEWKWDGISLSLEYKNGVLVQALTRGDGTTGDDVTDNAKVLGGIPLRVPDENFTNIVRGEALITDYDFKIINEEREKAGLELFANPRNAASIIRSGKNPEDVKNRRIRFKAFKIVNSEVNSDEDKDYLKELGFDASETLKIIDVDTNIGELISEKDYERTLLEYPTDGLVISALYKKVRFELGEGVKFPRWAKAYKFNPKGAASKLLGVTWQVGKYGTLTPVAELEPVSVAGSTISRATLHNIDYIRSKGMKVGDVMYIVKAAEVIPKVDKVISTSPDSTEIHEPEYCPYCSTKTIKDGAALKCPSKLCTMKIRAQLISLVSKDILDMEGFGPNIIDYLMDVKDVHWMFQLLDETNYDDLAYEDGFGEATRMQLIESIRKVKKGTELYRLIPAMMIEGIGRTIGKKIAEVNTLENIYNGSIEFNPTIGEKAREIIQKELLSEEGINHFRKMAEGIIITNTLNHRKSDVFKGKTFCISGSLPTTKDKLEKLIRENGGMMVSGVSKNLSYLICEDLSNSKPQKAMKLDIPVISYKAFMDLLK